MVWLLTPSLPDRHQEGKSKKVPPAEHSCWELICCKLSDVFEKPGTPPEKAIKHEIDLLLDSVLPAKR